MALLIVHWSHHHELSSEKEDNLAYQEHSVPRDEAFVRPSLSMYQIVAALQAPQCLRSSTITCTTYKSVMILMSKSTNHFATSSEIKCYCCRILRKVCLWFHLFIEKVIQVRAHNEYSYFRCKTIAHNEKQYIKHKQ